MQDPITQAAVEYRVASIRQSFEAGRRRRPRRVEPAWTDERSRRAR